MPINVREAQPGGIQVLPHAVSFNVVDGFRAVVETAGPDGTLKVGQEYKITLTPPDSNPAKTYTAKYLYTNGFKYEFGNLLLHP